MYELGLQLPSKPEARPDSGKGWPVVWRFPGPFPRQTPRVEASAGLVRCGVCSEGQTRGKNTGFIISESSGEKWQS